MYFPVVIQWLVLAAYYRSITLPFIANPSLHLSGMVGAPKSALMQQATGKAKETILPWIRHVVTDEPAATQAITCLAHAANEGFGLPMACKPDIGCRGAGVKLVETQTQLIDIISSYPQGAALICQKLASHEMEAGIFYVRDPETGAVEIPSLTIKILPRVTGDAIHTLGQLISMDPRAGKLAFLYHARHRENWERVIAKNETVRLVFSASHSKGAIFTDARAHISEKMKQSIADIMQGLPDFHYGRLDVKFPDLQSLKDGQRLEIVEINGASAESIHIWDKDARFTHAVSALLWQYRTLFRIGAYHRSKGKKPPSLATFLKSWRLERSLTKNYPVTD